MKMLVVLLPLLFLFLGQGSRIHGQIICQLFRQIFCHSRSSGIVQMIAAILRIGGPVETGWELTVVIVISQVVFFGSCFTVSDLPLFQVFAEGTVRSTSRIPFLSQRS